MHHNYALFYFLAITTETKSPRLLNRLYFGQASNVLDRWRQSAARLLGRDRRVDLTINWRSVHSLRSAATHPLTVTDFTSRHETSLTPPSIISILSPWGEDGTGPDPSPGYTATTLILHHSELDTHHHLLQDLPELLPLLLEVNLSLQEVFEPQL